MLKIPGLLGSGKAATGQTFDLVLKDAEGQPCADAVVTLRAMTRARAREITRQFQKLVPDPATRQQVPYMSPEAQQDAKDALLLEVIESWRGVVGLDDEPLPVTPEVVSNLPDFVQAQIIAAVFGAEVVEQASFRAPGDILPMVEGGRA